MKERMLIIMNESYYNHYNNFNNHSYYPEGILVTTTENSDYASDPVYLEKAMLSGKILESRAVLCDSNHNLTVDLGTVKGIIPREEAALGISDGSVRDIAIITRVNKPVAFKVMKVFKEKNGEITAWLSRAEAQRECVENYISKLKTGDIIDAKVTHLEPFGCFADIGCGIIAMIPIDSISVSRIMHPKDRFYPGQFIKAVVKDIDRESGKITLSHKELLGTWEENAAHFQMGMTASGIIRSVEDYGVFVELAPNLAGLAEFKEEIHPGQHTAVFIKSIIPDKMKIKLIIIDCFDGEFSAGRFNYYIDRGHLDRWVYSPSGCGKVVESVFSENKELKAVVH